LDCLFWLAMIVVDPDATKIRVSALAEEVEKPKTADNMTVVVAVNSMILRNTGLALAFSANAKSADAHI